MPLILLTNDDGYDAPGLQLLADAVADLGQVWMIAPHIERSACGRSVTLDRPLRVEQRGENRLAVDGTPADCVLLGLRALLPAAPELVVSGINRGYNLGEDLDYSGTVAGAAEGALQGAGASMAISVGADSPPAVFERAAAVARGLALMLVEQPLPRGCYLNVNLPADATDRVRWTRQGNPLAPGTVDRGRDPRGKPYYWIANRPDEDDPPPDTDRGAVARGVISITPMTLDRTFRASWNAPDLGRTGLRLEPAE